MVTHDERYGINGTGARSATGRDDERRSEWDEAARVQPEQVKILARLGRIILQR